MHKLSLLIILFFSALVTNAQESQPEMADAFRDNGKIYVVISVIGLIFIALIIFLLYLERKVSSLEKEIGKTDKVLK